MKVLNCQHLVSLYSKVKSINLYLRIILKNKALPLLVFELLLSQDRVGNPWQKRRKGVPAVQFELSLVFTVTLKVWCGADSAGASAESFNGYT